ncbi:MAG: thymidine phosphorylase, partial [Candidatus Bathyarchaeota archaeon]
MKLQARLLDIQAGGRRIAILDDETASLIGVHSSDRVEITHKKKHLVAIVNVAGNFPSNVVGVYEEVSARLGIKSGDIIDVQPAQRPEAVNHVQAKIRGERLREAEAKMIVEEVVERHLSDVEIASFVTALHIHGLSMDEIEVLSKAMVETGSTLTFDKAPILDKHSIG